MRNHRAGFWLAFTAVSTLGVSAAFAAAPAKTSQPQADATVYSSFPTFVQSLSSARAEPYVGRQPGGVQDARAFEDMRAHLLKLYSGVAVNHTFDLRGQTFDCVPLMQQPAVRLTGMKTIATPPPAATIRRGAGTLAVQVSSGSRDAFGSLQQCERDTVPMRRLTLDELSRFRTLRAFLRKSPNGGDSAPGQLADPNGHSYATGNQTVKNWGAEDFINVWDTQIDRKAGQTFDLSQSWTTGGSGTALQTAETGWQNFPAKYGTKYSVLFIYYTADGYQKTGCYNLECVAFVQTNSAVTLGGTFQNYSAWAGPQYQIYLGYFLYQGNWWLFANGASVGYYPGSVYKKGALTKHADTVEYGGEVCCTGAKSWPDMGSGSFADTGYSYAAFHSEVMYFDSSQELHSAKLKPYTPSPACYTFDETDSFDPPDFFFGGPGGKATKC